MAPVDTCPQMAQNPIDEAEFEHLMIFLLAQLRAECGRVIDCGLAAPYEAFDAEMAALMGEIGD